MVIFQGIQICTYYSQFTLALNSSPTDLSSKIPGSRDPGLPGKPPLTPHHPHGHPVPHAAAALPPPIGAVPHPADLLRGAAAAPPLFAPGLPRPGPPTADPLNPFGLPRPPYPSLFGPSPLGERMRCLLQNINFIHQHEVIFEQNC